MPQNRVPTAPERPDIICRLQKWLCASKVSIPPGATTGKPAFDAANAAHRVLSKCDNPSFSLDNRLTQNSFLSRSGGLASGSGRAGPCFGVTYFSLASQAGSHAMSFFQTSGFCFASFACREIKEYVAFVSQPNSADNHSLINTTF